MRKKSLLAITMILILSGCAIHKQLRITSEPENVRISRDGGIIGTTPFNLTVGAGDIFFCTPSYWSFILEAEAPYAGQSHIQKHINPCRIPDNSIVHFGFRLAQTPQQQVPPSEKPRRTGTGFVVDNSGLVLTAFHVVDGATNIKARCSDGTWTEATLKSFSRANDIALLVSQAPLKGALALAQDNSARVGDEVYTLGYPVVGVLGDEQKYSNGTISSLSGLQGDNSFLQISVPVQPGNSGGPLCNTKGEVIGLITSSAAIEYFYGKTGALPQNINWAVKIEYASPLVGSTISRKSSVVSGKKTLQEVGKGICLIVAN
jgi:S1-C subfamily serine protease